MAKIQIKQVKSRINRPARQKRTLDALGLRKSALAPFDFGFRYTAGTFDSIKYMLMCAAMGAGCAWMGFLQWKSGEEISEVAGGGAIAFVIAIVVLGFRR